VDDPLGDPSDALALGPVGRDNAPVLRRIAEDFPIGLATEFKLLLGT
jgi:hypothetical protein